MAPIETLNLNLIRKSIFHIRLLRIHYYLLPFLLIATGIGIRVFYVLSGPELENQYWSDMRIYMKISKAIDYGVWTDSHFFQSIGYPLLISGVKKISDNFGSFLTWLQALASSLTLVFLYLMIRNSLGRRVGLISLALGTIHLPWILFSNFALPETFFTLLLSVAGYLSQRIIYSRRPHPFIPILWGLAFILAWWLKGIHALWGPIFLIGLMIIKRKESFLPVFLISSIVGGGLLGHAFLTHQKIGKIQFGPSTGGLNLVEGKCPSKINTDSAGFHWQSPLYFQLGLNHKKDWSVPFTDSGYYFKQGLKCIQENPLVLLQSFESIPFLFYGNTLWPFNRLPIAGMARLYELFLVLFFVPGIMIFLLRFKNFAGPKEFVMWICPMLAIFLCVYIFKAEMRYRIPFDLWFIPVAAKGWLELAAIKNLKASEL